MPQSGRKNRENIHLSQKRTCGRIDRGAGGCYAYEDQMRGYADVFHGDTCALDYRCKDGKPLEPCLKPVTESQYVYAMKLRGQL